MIETHQCVCCASARGQAWQRARGGRQSAPYPELRNVAVRYHLWLGFLQLKAFFIGWGCIYHRWLENRWYWCAVGIHLPSR